MPKRNQKLQNQALVREKFNAQRQLPQIHPKSQNQKLFVDSINTNCITVGKGVAGTGKTLLACYIAAKELHNRNINRIVLIRAYQPLAGRSIGLLPGTLEEKLMPFYQQMIDYLQELLGKTTTEIHLKNKTIEICALEAIRGKSWDDCIVICDEAQNLFVPEIQALTTRIGYNTKMIFIGDGSGVQTDVRRGMNGLEYLEKIIQKYSIDNVGFVEFNYNDIMRSDITKDFVIAYDKELTDKNPIT